MDKLFIVFIVAMIGTLESAKVPMENSKLFEGDIVMSPGEFQAFHKAGINPDIPLSSSTFARWPKTIPFLISDELINNPADYSAIRNALLYIQQVTCLRFVFRKNETAYLNFIKGKGCFSYIGYGHSKRDISIGEGCGKRGIVIHEVSHALGFFHEQSRPDRDSYVTINFNNIAKADQIQFTKESSQIINYRGSPYDYDSIMHYGAYFFSKNDKKTIETLDPKDSNRIGQRNLYSSIDIQQINELYQCKDKLASLTSTIKARSRKKKAKNTRKDKDTFISGSMVHKSLITR